MQTHFTEEQLKDPDMFASEDIVSRCLQCGYCMPHCPTYMLLEDEQQSPKGRVALIKDMLESDSVPEANTVKSIDQCLSCLTCMSSCPSFVNYMHLVDHARAYIEDNYQRPLVDRLARWTLAKTLPYPDRFRTAAKAAKAIKPFARALPKPMRRMVQAVPGNLSPASQYDQPQIFPAEGERLRRVALLTGCAQQVLNTNINEATIRLLCRHGCEVVVAKDMGCCGALTHHMGKHNDSHTAAARNIRAWMKEVNGEGLDAVVINASGCGTVVKDYAHMFRDSELAVDAKKISELAEDVSETLGKLELDYKIKPEMRVVYHATCSLQYGQRIRFAPRKLLKAVGFTVLEAKDAQVCCGSAATYHLLQPELSDQLKSMKVKSLEDTSAQAVVAGNIGCMTHIASGTTMPVVHTVELLDWVTGGLKPDCLNVD